jgi:hypothetical protein
MGDVARALLLPDIYVPNLSTLRNLAAYWDEVLCPCYDVSHTFNTDDPLVREGVVRVLERDISAARFFPAEVEVDGEDEWAYQAYRDDDGEMKVRLVPKDDDSTRYWLERDPSDFSDAEVEGLTAITLGRHLGFIDDALAMAASNHLAPVSHSLGGHLAAVIGSSEEGPDARPAREAALLSVVVDAFAIDPETSSEELLRFRESTANSRARLRGSLVDLAERLRGDTEPVSMLAEARDTYRNRVEPALGDLEEALKESRIKFLLKSLVGATAIAIAPIEPVSTSAGAARVLGQSIDYSYSKSKLLREHPYGYLHAVRSELGTESSAPSRPDDVLTTMMAPRESLRELWNRYWQDARGLDLES